MALIFQVGDPQDFAQMPPNFPQCGDWKPNLDGSFETNDKKVSNFIIMLLQGELTHSLL